MSLDVDESERACLGIPAASVVEKAEQAMAIDVSVVIPVLNGALTIPDQLDALSRQTFNGSWEVIVADNGSSDETLTVVRTYEDKVPRLRVADASHHRGPHHARNVGVRGSLGELILFCDADDVADSGWVAAMAEAAGSFDLWGGPLEVYRLNDVTSATWMPPHPTWASSLQIACGFLPLASSSNLGIARSTFDRLGGFDESYRGASEDLDLSWRAQLAGFCIGFEPDAVMFRRYRSSAMALCRQYYGYGLSQTQVFRRFRRQGMPRDDARTVARTWLWLATRAPTLLTTPARRGAWIRTLSKRSGRLVGSIRHRVVYL